MIIKEKEVFQKIIDLCEQNTDTEGTLKEILLKAKNRVILYEWEERYGIRLEKHYRFAEYDFAQLGEYRSISYFENGHKGKEKGSGRYISWSEGDRQPVDEWLYEICFPTGAYIFGDDYKGQLELFKEFFEELRTYKPDYEDLHNHRLCWKLENAKAMMDNFLTILNRYKDKNRSELKARQIANLEKELSALKSSQ